MTAKQSHEPTDRLTKLCAQMTAVLNIPENHDVRAIVFLTDKSKAGIQAHGYDDLSEAAADLFLHLQAMFEAQGKRLDFMAMDSEGVTRIEGPEEEP